MFAKDSGRLRQEPNVYRNRANQINGRLDSLRHVFILFGQRLSFCFVHSPIFDSLAEEPGLSLRRT